VEGYGCYEFGGAFGGEEEVEKLQRRKLECGVCCL
jgi:hypothetical protein